MLIHFEGRNLEESLQVFPSKVKIIKAEEMYAVLRADSRMVNSLKTFVMEKGFKTVSTSGTIKGLFRKSKRLNRST